MRIKMIQCTICLLASLPPAFIHPLNLFIAAARALVLLSTGNGDEGVDLRQRVRILSVAKYNARHRVRKRLSTCPGRGPAVAAAPPAETAVPGELYGPPGMP